MSPTCPPGDPQPRAEADEVCRAGGQHPDAVQARLVREFEAGELTEAQVQAVLHSGELGHLQVGLLEAGHCVLLGGEPVEWVDMAGGRGRLFEASRSRQQVEVAGAAAGRCWITTAQLQQHSEVSLGYVCGRLEDQAAAEGLLLHRRAQRHAVSLLEVTGNGWRVWHLLAAQGQRGAQALVVSTRAVGNHQAAADSGQ